VEAKHYPFAGEKERNTYKANTKNRLTREEYCLKNAELGERFCYVANTEMFGFSLNLFCGIRIRNVLQMKWQILMMDGPLLYMNKNEKPFEALKTSGSGQGEYWIFLSTVAPVK